MKRTRFSRRSKQTPATEELIHLAGNLSQSSSRLEDEYWQARLAGAIDRLLGNGDDATLNSALDHLYGAGGRAYDELADLVESCCETRRLEAGTSQDVVLFAAPVLAWSRFVIPSGSIAPELMATLRVQLQAHVLARDVRLGLADFLWSPDQLPQSYGDTAQLTERLAKAALHGRDLKIEPSTLPETVNFLSDTRYLIGAAAAPRGSALFRWQEDDGSRAEALKQWRSQGGDALRPMLPACALELLLPQPYHAAAREADRASRPYSLRAAVAFLQTTLNVAAAELRAVAAGAIGRFGAIDPTEGGATSRYDLHLGLRSRGDASRRWTAMAYASRYRLDLFSNFTFFLDDPVNGDGIEQVDDRTFGGVRGELEIPADGGASSFRAGMEMRYDDAAVGLFRQRMRARFATRSDARVREGHAGAWASRSFRAAARLHGDVGVRGDLFRFAAVDRELIQSAQLDGAGRWQTFRYVLLPSIATALLAGGMLHAQPLLLGAVVGVELLGALTDALEERGIAEARRAEDHALGPPPPARRVLSSASCLPAATAASAAPARRRTATRRWQDR